MTQTQRPGQAYEESLREGAAWLKHQFECEWCPECGRDHRHHTAIKLGLGDYGENWFARCDREPVYDDRGEVRMNPEGYAE